MQILLHAGVHPTDNDLLLGSMLNNQAALHRHKVAVPKPALYRRSLRQAMRQVEQNTAPDDLRNMLINGLMVDQPKDATAILLSIPLFFEMPKHTISNNVFYHQGERKLELLQEIFGADSVSLFMSIRDPATLIPSLMQICETAQMADVLSRSNPMALRWSEFFQRLRKKFAEMPMNIWCFEDAPFVWPKIIRAFGGLPPTQAITDTYRIFLNILTDTGQDRFVAYMKTHPDLSVNKKNEVMFAFAEKFARMDLVDMDVSVTGWSQDDVDFITDLYEQDTETLATIPNLRIIQP